MPRGAWGHIAVSDQPEPRKGTRPAYRAKARFRDSDGITRTVVRYGQTKGRARTALLAALSERGEAVRSDTLNPNTPLDRLAELWVEREQAAWTAGTLDTYAYVVANQVRPALGKVRLGEIRQSDIHRALAAIRDANGPSVAKTTKSVLSGMFRLAMSEGAINANPALGAIRLPSKPAKGTVRALTPDEVRRMVDGMRADDVSVEMDLPDLVEWMLGTGCRIGEACAARDTALDLDAGTWEINATLKRANGVGLFVQERPKTAAGWRVLALPSFAVLMVKDRRDRLRFNPDSVQVMNDRKVLRVQTGMWMVFPWPTRPALRDPSNTAGDLRAALDRLGFDWVTSHVFRKTVGTRLDEAGFSAREIADQLGHARPSLTMDTYMGRKVVSARAASVLDR